MIIKLWDSSGLCAAFSIQLILIGYIAGTVITTTS